jgi:flavin reductase (DIM6/NTAB) family NADH-FMN oxidoreductase RutF
MLEFNTEQSPTDALRATFRRHASGVSVITCTDPDGNPVGFTATSMTSLGATPPLIMFSVACGSSSWNAVSQTEYIAVHTLGAGNLALAQRMAADHTQRFVPQDWTWGPHDVPVFPAATSVLVAKVRQLLNIENNAVVIADVVDGALGHEDAALLYHQRGYHSPGETLS